MLKELNQFVTVLGALTVKEMFDEFISERRKKSGDPGDSSQTGVQQLREEFQAFMEDRSEKLRDKLDLARQCDLVELRQRVEELERQLAEVRSGQAESAAKGH